MSKPTATGEHYRIADQPGETCHTCEFREDHGEAPSTCTRVVDKEGNALEVDRQHVCDLWSKGPASGGGTVPESRNRQEVAMDDDSEFGAIGIGSGPSSTTDEAWDGPGNVAKLSNDAGASTYRKVFAWVDPDGDKDKKGSYSFPHHMVGDSGSIGAANVKACSSGIGILNGGRGASGKWTSDKRGIYNHLAGHLRASGVKGEDLPKLKGAAAAAAADQVFDRHVLEQTAKGIDEATARAAAAVLVSSYSIERLAELTGTTVETLEAEDVPTVYAELVTPVSPDTLTAKVDEIRQRRHEDASLLRVRVGDDDEWVELPVRWDDERRRFVPTAPEAPLTADGQLVDNPGAAWHAILCVEGLRTDEDPGREIMPGAAQFPDLPVSLRLQIADEGGHYGAVSAGTVETMERQERDGYNVIYGTGTFSESENGQLAQLLVTEQSQRFISIDPRDVQMEIVELPSASPQITPVGPGIIGYNGTDDDDEDDEIPEKPDEGQWWVRYTKLTIGAATIVATPALQQAVIALSTVDLPETPIAVKNAPPTSVTIQASGEPDVPSNPPGEWFDDPRFHVGDPRLVRQADGHHACPLTVEGRRVYGHIAYWGAHHTGLPGQRRQPPRSPTYAYYMTGSRLTAEGDVVAVGNITMGCGHASTTIRDATKAKAHYLTPLGESVAHYDGGYGAVQMADVRAGEDDFGIWVAGVLCDDVTTEQVRKFASLGLSGDWRTIAGKLHLVAALAVPVPGFPIAREEALVASAEVIDLSAVRAGVDSIDGDPFSLVAAGRVRRVPTEERLNAIEDQLAVLMRDRQSALDAAALEELTAVL